MKEHDQVFELDYLMMLCWVCARCLSESLNQTEVKPCQFEQEGLLPHHQIPEETRKY